MKLKAFSGILFGAVFALGIGSTAVQADSYPSKPITMIIPLGAGGSHDLNARVFTSIVPEYLGNAIIVKLMPGASGQKGTAAAARAKPDGYTLLFTHNYIDQLQQHIEKLPYDTTKDLVTVARLNYGPISLITKPNKPWKNLKELIAYGKKNPGKLKMATSGNWGAVMVPAARVFAKAGVQVNYIPYKGGGPAFRAFLANEVDFTMMFPSVIKGRVKKGTIRVLASAGKKPMFKDAPTFSQLGFDDDIGYMNRVILAPRGIPAARLKVLRTAIAKLKKNKTYKKMMKKLGENTAYMSGDEYEKIRAKQKKRYGNLVKKLTN